MAVHFRRGIAERGGSEVMQLDGDLAGIGSRERKVVFDALAAEALRGHVVEGEARQLAQQLTPGELAAGAAQTRGAAFWVVGDSEQSEPAMHAALIPVAAGSRWELGELHQH